MSDKQPLCRAGEAFRAACEHDPEGRQHLEPIALDPGLADRLRHAVAGVRRIAELAEASNRPLPELDLPAVEESSSEEASTKRGRMTTEEANKAALRVAEKVGKDFFGLPERRQAILIGCHVQTWRKTELYRKRWPHGR